MSLIVKEIDEEWNVWNCVVVKYFEIFGVIFMIFKKYKRKNL